jgi:hypothetical protein
MLRVIAFLGLLAVSLAAPIPHETGEAHEHGSDHFHGEHHHDAVGLCHDHPHSEGDEVDGDGHACGHRLKREAHETGEAHEHGSDHFHGEHHHDAVGLCHDHPHSEGDEVDGDGHACGHRLKREAHETGEAHEHGSDHFHGEHHHDAVGLCHDHPHSEGDEVDEDGHACGHRLKREAHETGEAHSHGADHFHGEHHHDAVGLCHDHPHSEGDEGDGDGHACGH